MLSEEYVDYVDTFSVGSWETSIVECSSPHGGITEPAEAELVVVTSEQGARSCNDTVVSRPPG